MVPYPAKSRTEPPLPQVLASRFTWALQLRPKRLGQISPVSICIHLIQIRDHLYPFVTFVIKYTDYPLCHVAWKVVTVVTLDEWMTMRSPSWSEDSQELDPDEDSQAMFFSPCCEQLIMFFSPCFYSQAYRPSEQVFFEIINGTLLQQVPLRRPSKKRKLVVEASCHSTHFETNHQNMILCCSLLPLQGWPDSARACACCSSWRHNESISFLSFVSNSRSLFLSRSCPTLAVCLRMEQASDTMYGLGFRSPMMDQQKRRHLRPIWFVSFYIQCPSLPPHAYISCSSSCYLKSCNLLHSDHAQTFKKHARLGAELLWCGASVRAGRAVTISILLP